MNRVSFIKSLLLAPLAWVGIRNLKPVAAAKVAAPPQVTSVWLHRNDYAHLDTVVLNGWMYVSVGTADGVKVWKRKINYPDWGSDWIELPPV